MVSIITPCYNSERYIEETIQSVINQTYIDWEMLIVDDCSTDNSAEIILKYAKLDSRVKYYKTPFASGSPTKPRNIAIENSKGRYIAFLDSDDIWLPSKLEEQLNVFSKFEDTVVVFSYYEKINEKGERNNRVIHSPSIVTYDTLLYGNVIGNLTGIYDTSKVGKKYLDSVGHEDYVLWLSILKHGYLARNTNNIQALYRLRNNSVSSNKLQTLKWMWHIYTQIEKIGYLKSSYYFMFYAFKAILKHFK